MKSFLMVLALLGMLTINGSACDSWKSEYFKLAAKTAAYGVTYTKYAKGKFSEAKFNHKKEKLIQDIHKIKSYVKNTESCEGKESRKTRLLDWISKVLDAIKNNSTKATTLAKEIREDFY